MTPDAPTSTAAPEASPPGQQPAPSSIARRATSIGGRVLRVFLYQRELTPIVITIGLFLYFAIRAGSSFTGSLSLASAAGYAGPIGAIAVGEVLLLVLAEIDLSAGQVFLFCPWMMYWMHQDGLPLAVAILIALLSVCLVGAINGLITVRLEVPSFVTTLAMNFILYGVVLVASNDLQGSPIPLSGGTSFISQAMGVWKWSEILWVLAITIVLSVLLTRSRFGVRIVATGGNLVGAAEAGVPIRRVKVWCFILCSFVAGLVGIVDAIKYGTLDPGNFGVDYILYAVGACVIGGTALTGGRGTVVGAFIGAILIGVLQDGLTVIGVSTNEFFIYVGVVIIIAMALNVQFDRIIARSRSR
ncbi:MAG TPA: ABC transporter permease [Solirubrobacteraceae bacterium]|nr:ABC transporter permease [Solirubrobacteraceae bacterium]